jgi:hypothetical protein
LDKQVSSIKVGEISKPFLTPKGMFIIKVIERHDKGLLPLDEAKPVLRDLIKTEKLQALEAKKLEDIRKKCRIKQWSGKTLPSPETIIVAVNGFEVTLKTYLETMTKKKETLESNPEYLNTVAKEFVRSELILRDLKRMGETNWLLANTLKLYEPRMYALELLRRYYEQSAVVTDEEARAYYEAHKTAYHSPSPKRLLALVFRYPTEDEEKSRVSREKTKREARKLISDFANTVSEEKFEQEAKDFIKKFEGKYDIRLEKMGPLEQLPEEFQTKLTLEQISLGGISRVIPAPSSYIVFKVIEEFPYRILPYEEVRKKPMSVVRATKEQAIRDSLKKEVLAAANFKIVEAQAK